MKLFPVFLLAILASCTSQKSKVVDMMRITSNTIKQNDKEIEALDEKIDNILIRTGGMVVIGGLQPEELSSEARDSLSAILDLYHDRRDSLLSDRERLASIKDSLDFEFKKY